MWYEWANTNRHQYPADPLQNWLDAPLPNFAETFVTNSYQPYAEYQLNATKKLTVTAHAFSKSALQKIEKAGGKAIVLAPPAVET